MCSLGYIIYTFLLFAYLFHSLFLLCLPSAYCIIVFVINLSFKLFKRRPTYSRDSRNVGIWNFHFNWTNLTFMSVRRYLEVLETLYHVFQKSSWQDFVPKYLLRLTDSFMILLLSIFYIVHCILYIVLLRITIIYEKST